MSPMNRGSITSIWKFHLKNSETLFFISVCENHSKIRVQDQINLNKSVLLIQVAQIFAPFAWVSFKLKCK